MMKSPTSLIRFRNAVGVMLALSAIFAVVISAVTITQDRAIAQETPTVSISVADADVDEGDTVDITVTLSEAVASGGTDVSITLTAGADSDTADSDDYTLNPDPAVVEFNAGGIATDTVSISFVNNDGAEPVETLTVSLTPPTGYNAGTATSIMFNIADDDNTPASGAVTIDVNDANGDPVDEDDQGNKVSGFIPKVGHVLTANTDDIADEDQPLTADTTDDADAKDAPSFRYQWVRTNDGSTPGSDDDVDIIGANLSTYELSVDDVGDTFSVKVDSTDQYGNGNDMPQNLFTLDGDGDVTAPASTAAVAYNLAKPFIIKGATRLRPDVELTRDSSGMVNDADNLIGDDGMEIMVDLDGPDCAADATECDESMDPDGDDDTVALSDVTFTWHRDGKPVTEDADSDPTTAPTPVIAEKYKLTNDDVAKTITLVASYTTRNAVLDDGNTADVDESMDAVMASIESEDIGRVYSPSKATGLPNISGVAQVGSMLTADINTIKDADGDPVVEADITYTWFYGDDADYSDPLGTGTTYDLEPKDVGNTIKVRASFEDGLGDPDMRVSGLTTEITGSPGEISRIEPGIRGITVSASDNVMLSVDIYGLQNAKDNELNGTFSWTQKSGDNVVDLDGSGREIKYPAPDSPGTYTIVATLGGGECQPADEDDREAACSATITVQVRRPSTAPDDGVAPQNPPGEIPTILTDGDGNQYEVFTPEGGGTFTGEGYTLNAGAGAIPNGEYIGVRVSDEGSASNAGMTHQRYTLGGNMYSVSAVDANNAEITSYVLNSAATVCVPLPDELRSNISNLALVAINADGSLTILSASVRLGTNGTQVCGNLSGLPASVAVGSSGAPAPLPTPVPPTATPEAPPTGGAAPTSNSALWALLLGFAVVASGTFLVIGRRRESTRK